MPLIFLWLYLALTTVSVSGLIQKTLVMTTAFVPQDSAVIKNPNMYKYGK